MMTTAPTEQSTGNSRRCHVPLNKPALSLRQVGKCWSVAKDLYRIIAGCSDHARGKSSLHRNPSARSPVFRHGALFLQGQQPGPIHRRSKRRAADNEAAWREATVYAGELLKELTGSYVPAKGSYVPAKGGRWKLPTKPGSQSSTFKSLRRTRSKGAPLTFEDR